MSAADGWALPADALDDAVRLQRDGKHQEALGMLRQLLPQLRASTDRGRLATALAAIADASIAVGDYQEAVRTSTEASDLHLQLGKRADAAWDLNAVGLAQLYLTRYDAAIDSYQRALALDRETGDADGEITRLNNIGNVHYMRGRYADALTLYQHALKTVDARATDRSRGRLRKMTLSNLAALYQRLGANERALDLYSQLRGAGAMQPSEEAQLLINEGALWRRLGDPAKALDNYRRAQDLFQSARHRDGEIGAWRNIGIVYALDLHDDARAFTAFDQALRLARASSNRRGVAQALLYHGELLRRRGQLTAAAEELTTALHAATDAGLVEEQWKALYSIGRVFEAEGRTADARRSYEQAIAAFETLRSDLRTFGLKSEFLADKRDVYDALIALHLAASAPSVSDVFQLIERSRARTWQDRVRQASDTPSLHDVQPRLAPRTLLLEYWYGAGQSAVLWASSSQSGLVRRARSATDDQAVQRLVDALQQSGEAWRSASVPVGQLVLANLPDLRGFDRVNVLTDGPLHSVPFEALVVPGSNELLLERLDVSYLPSAALFLRTTPPARRWMWPWQREFIGFGDPGINSPDPVSGNRAASLPSTEEELRGIAAALPGRAQIHFGTAGQRSRLSGNIRGIPLLHFAAHAVADTRDPDRSRVLLTSSAKDAPDYLFLREIYDLDLTGVQLVTMSACSTERGPVIRGEGVEGFSRALLAAGAGATVTTLWDVADQASAEFMKQFYFALAQGQSESAALRRAKLQFLRSSLAWAHPRYWAGYVLTGHGTARLPRVVPWSAVVGAPIVVTLAIVAVVRLRRSRSRS